MDGQNEIKEIDRLILKYLEGEASKDEKIELYRWIELSEENKTHFKEAQELWLSTQAILAPKEDTEKHYGVSVLKSRTTIAAAKHSANHSTTLPSVQPQ